MEKGAVVKDFLIAAPCLKYNHLWLAFLILTPFQNVFIITCPYTSYQENHQKVVHNPLLFADGTQSFPTIYKLIFQIVCKVEAIFSYRGSFLYIPSKGTQHIPID